MQAGAAPPVVVGRGGVALSLCTNGDTSFIIQAIQA
jgi:hypothetical protein